LLLAIAWTSLAGRRFPLTTRFVPPNSAMRTIHVEDAIERDPYSDIEHQSRRACVFARRQDTDG
jgi:hypothetical protein